MAARAHYVKVSIEVQELAGVHSLRGDRTWRQIQVLGDSLFARVILELPAIDRSKPRQAAEQDGGQRDFVFPYQLRVDPAE